MTVINHVIFDRKGKTILVRSSARVNFIPKCFSKMFKPETKKRRKKGFIRVVHYNQLLVFKRLMICSFSLSGKWNENSRFSLMTEEENAIEK